MCPSFLLLDRSESADNFWCVVQIVEEQVLPPKHIGERIMRTVGHDISSLFLLPFTNLTSARATDFLKVEY